VSYLGYNLRNIMCCTCSLGNNIYISLCTCVRTDVDGYSSRKVVPHLVGVVLYCQLVVIKYDKVQECCT
jgi:hypothetical protein